MYDPVGDRYAEPACRALAPGGRYVVIGFAAGEIPKLPANLFLLKNAQLVGSGLGPASALNPSLKKSMQDELMTMFYDGKLKPINSAIYDLKDAESALDDISNRRVRGKVLVVTPKFHERYSSKSML